MIKQTLGAIVGTVVIVGCAGAYLNQPFEVVDESGACVYVVEPWHKGYDGKEMTTECGTYGELEMGPSMSQEDYEK